MHETGVHLMFPLYGEESICCTVEPFEESTLCQKLMVSNSLLLTTKWCPGILSCGVLSSLEFLQEGWHFGFLVIVGLPDSLTCVKLVVVVHGFKILLFGSMPSFFLIGLHAST